MSLVTADWRVAASGPYDLLIADPPYGETSLKWDRRIYDWQSRARELLKPTGSLWCFGSMRFFIEEGPAFAAAGLHFAQDVVWEKHNGSGFAADRFKRVHEHIAQFYPDTSKWSEIYNEVQTTPDATARTVRLKKRPPHMGNIEAGAYRSFDGGPRLARSVVYMRSCHGHAIHRTQKPVELIELLIRTSCPPGGLVGDLFAGSGSAGVAARRCGRDYEGFEIDPATAAEARARISAELI